MERLCALKQEGMLTEEEFIWAKAQLMVGKGPADDDRLDSPSGEAPLPSVASAAGTSRSLYSSNRVAASTAPDDGEADESGSRMQLSDAANVGGDHGANVDQDGGQQEPSSPPPCPGFFKRHLAIVPPIETLGLFLKEQMPVFRKHWVESKRHDGRSLREDMIMLFESQLTTAALLFSAFTGLMFGAVTEENWDAFHADDWPTHIGFWLITVGTFACINSMFYLMFSFVAIMIILPISDQNIYFLLKLPSTQRTMTQVNVQLIITFFSGIAFIALMLIDRSRNSIFMISLILSIIFVISQIIAFTFSHTLNLSMLGGFYGSKPVIDHHLAENMSGSDLEKLLVQPALQYRKMNGFKDPNPTEFYKDKYLQSEQRRLKQTLSDSESSRNMVFSSSGRNLLSGLKKTGLGMRKKAMSRISGFS